MVVDNELVVNEFKIRVLDESIPRILKCLSMISESDLWHAPNEQITSIGCSIQHLLGNANQWVLSGILGDIDERDRSSEFIANNFVNTNKLSSEITQFADNLNSRLSELESLDLSIKVTIQGFEVSRFSAIVHVTEHFSYHTGQITLLTKLFTENSTGYYSGLDLNIKN